MKVRCSPELHVDITYCHKCDIAVRHELGEEK